MDLAHFKAFGGMLQHIIAQLTLQLGFVITVWLLFMLDLQNWHVQSMALGIQPFQHMTKSEMVSVILKHNTSL